jgi:hypothetical protein
MAAEFKIGRLRFNWQGSWTPGSTYARDDVVFNDGSAYACLVPSVASENFYTDLYAVPYPVWQKVTDGKTWAGNWTTSHSYGLNHVVVFGGVVYYCITAHTSSTFANDVANWAEYTEFTAWHTGWATSTAYGKNDVVKYGGIVYKCIANHTSAATTLLGLEANINSWTIVDQGIEYKGIWVASTRYKVRDVVKLNADLYICSIYNTNTTFTPANWTLWFPGKEYQGTWANITVYQPGDVVVYGGYTYISNTVNNTSNTPSTDNTNWTLLAQGFNFQNDWSVSGTYKIGSVVRRHGQLYDAIADNSNQDPAAYSVSTTYTASGSSGTTLKVNNTSGISTGMNIINPAFTAGQSVVSVTNSTTLVISAGPDGAIADSASLSFVGVNYTYWSILVPGTSWTNKWVTSTQYVIGDIAVWQNGTYVCVQNHVATSNNRPDNDSTNTYWIFYIPHARKNALNALGDIETYTTGPGYAAIPIGTQSYMLKAVSQNPTWSTMNIVPAVYYVCSSTGQDILTYGKTWDQPWKSIQYATQIVGAGTNYPNAVNSLKQNKTWLLTEMWNWMTYNMSQSTNGYTPNSVFDETKTFRDAGFVIDAVAYDLSRGGNSQTVAATLAYFAFGSNGTLFDSAILTEINYFVSSLQFLSTLISTNVIPNTPASPSYQTLNGNAVVISQVNNVLASESGSAAAASSLLNIVTTALSTQSTSQVPQSNNGTTATIFVKTGTYSESLPIYVPENTAIFGDELRGVVVQPATSITGTVTAINPSPTNTVTVSSTTGLTDQMPIQFVDPTITTTFIYSAMGGVTAGQTYYVAGSTITSTSFGITNAPTFSFTGTTTSNSSVINFVSNYSNLVVGASITGAGIPSGTTILTVTATALTSTYSISISNPATANGSNVQFVQTGVPVTLIAPSSTVSMNFYAGDCLKDMFRLRNGTGLRNMTLTGLLGTLGAPDLYTIQRPTGGSFACLDPGNGPNDTSVWIFRRSPYVQNVTAFGNGCAGYKVDGTLHNGGNKSIVTNDFTHIVNDGIGIWCTGPSALTEAVSVFSYYGYSGYLADAGGRIRATNGNSSYGTYGVIATGYDVTETPASGIIFNQSSQVQATVQQAYGTNSQLLRLDYTNAGSNYFTTTTNMLNFSNNFLGASWSSDGNVSFSKVTVAPTGLTEGWTLIGGTSGTDGSYLYQNISIPSAGATYTGLSALNISGTGTNATFNVTVTSTGYSVTVLNPGSGYAVYSAGSGSQLYIPGSQLGGLDNVNNCVINVTGLTGNGIQSISLPTAGTSGNVVPAGSNLSYTCSIEIKQGTSPNVDLYAIFSGGASGTVTSSINYNFLTNVVTPSSAGGGYTPTRYGAINLQTSSTASNAGWYRLWFAVNDTTGLNTQLQFRFYPRGYTGLAGQYTYAYASQVEQSAVPVVSSITQWTASTVYSVVGQYLYSGNNVYRVTSAGTSNTIAPGFTSGNGSSGTYGVGLSYQGAWTPSFYQEVVGNTKYSAYANFNISGAGTGVVTNADEIRSNSVFNTRIATDSNGVTGGAGYLTASNNAQSGGTQYIQLSGSDTNTNGNYTGMRVFINSGTGAGQYGYISYFDSRNTGGTSKFAYVLKESFTSLQITGTNQGTGYFTLGGTNTTNTLYLNQPVQFIPTYYTTSITSTGLAQTTCTATIGGIINTMTVGSTLGMYVNMPLTFSSGGSGVFSTVTTGYYYYIYAIIDSVTIQITNQLYGNIWQLSNVTPVSPMTINFPSNNSFLQASTTNMVVNYPIQFTGTALGGLNVGTVYYIQDIIDSYDFTVSTGLVTVSVTTTTAGTSSGLANNYWGTSAPQYLVNVPTLTVSTNTSSLVLLAPILFATVIDGSITEGSKYYISNIINSTTFTIASSLITQTVTQTTAISNLVTCSDTSLFQINQPIKFIGTSFDQYIKTETSYYISTIQSATTFTISQSPGGPNVNLNGGAGSMTLNTCPAALALAGGSGTMTGTTTQTKSALSLGIGSMNGTFSTSLFGGTSVTIGQTYYVQSIPNTTTFAVSLTTGTASGTSTSASPISLVTKTGSMNVAAVGWDHINPGTPIASVIDNTSVYYIEPRTLYSAPPFTQTAALTPVSLGAGTTWSAVAWGNGVFLALPSTNTLAAYSTDGTNWSSLSLPSSKSWSGVAYGNGYWVVISSGGSGNSTVAVSKSNGLGWRSYTLPIAATWPTITYGNGIFVAVASGTNSVAYSTNYGTSWTQAYMPSTHLFTATGNAQLSTTQKQFGTSSLYLDGTANTYISSPSNADYGYGTGDFTIECWVYVSAFGAAQAIFDQRVTATDVSILAEISAAGVFRIYVNGSYVITGNTTISANTWTHVAVSRASGTTRLFVGGVVQTSTYTDSNNYAAKAIVIGAYYTGAQRFTGYIDEFRVTKGTGYYTATFTPTVSAFNSDSYTIALLHFDGANASTSIASSDGALSWSSIAYGNNLFVAVSSTGTAVATQTLTGGGTSTTNTFTVASTTGIVTGQLVVGTGLATGTTVSNVNSGTGTITVSNNFNVQGAQTYKFYAATSTQAAYSTNGSTWTASTMPAGRWTSIAYGQSMFVAVSSLSGLTCYSFDAKTWYSSILAIAATSVTYGQGVFLALNNTSATAYTSEDGIQWIQQTVTNDGYSAVCFGYTSTLYNGLFVTLAGFQTASTINAGCITKGRATVNSGVINYINQWESGSGYISGGTPVVPTAGFTDPNVTTLAVVNPRTSNGVLSSPTFYNRGTGYTTASTQVVITGNGFADTYQTGLTIVLNNLTRLPSPGDNLTISGVSQVYKVTSAYSVFNTVVPLLEANVSVSPSVSVANATSNGTVVSIRSKYSQARLTNHDFLNIGYGDQDTSNYPGYPDAGYSSTPSNQTVETNFGRVFYTSTDQDGNFKVGGLFGVQQATGIVTLSASQFGLSGLNSLSLGGISVGGSSVVVTQFSTDSTFTANSDAILPTQKAIKSYLTSRLSQGGSNTFTGQLTAGTIVVGGANFIRSTIANGTSGSVVKMANKVYIAGAGVDGNMQALDFFMRGATRRTGRTGFGTN